MKTLLSLILAVFVTAAAAQQAMVGEYVGNAEALHGSYLSLVLNIDKVSGQQVQGSISMTHRYAKERICDGIFPVDGTLENDNKFLLTLHRPENHVCAKQRSFVLLAVQQGELVGRFDNTEIGEKPNIKLAKR